MSGESSSQIVKELAVAVSTQAQVANRYWLTLMTVALFALLPRIAGPEAGTITLPFGLGAVESASLNPILFGLLIVLAVAFAAAHAQQVRAQKLAQRYIDDLQPAPGQLHPRELFDMLRQPSVIRVAPLAQSLRGRFQFYATANECPAHLWWISVVYYGLLKVASIAVYFLLPWWAIVSVAASLHNTTSRAAVIVVPALAASVVLLQVMVADLVYTWQVLKRLAHRSAQQTG